MSEPRFVRETLPATVAAVAARQGERVAVIVDESLTDITARWAGCLAFSRMTTSPTGAYGAVMREEIPTAA
ncbi:MAG: hypothetical protein M3O99_02115 [Chloroflexota bacterium]|nr:hypothetical protein [Chloroflexota bacterium]